MWDARTFKGTFAFDEKTMAFRYEDLGYGHTTMELRKFLTKPAEKIMIVQNGYFHAVQKAGKNFYVYNCHSSARNPLARPEADDPAAIIQSESVHQVAEILFNASKIGVDQSHLFNVYSIFCKISDAE